LQNAFAFMEDFDVSVELPEAYIIAEQLNEVLPGKEVESYRLEDYERLHRIGFLNKDLTVFEGLVGGKVDSATSRGNVVLVKLDNGMNLLIGPEYGGRVLYHEDGEDAPRKIHLKIDFTDGAAMTVRLTGMGIIQAHDDDSLRGSYVYERDFSETPSPLEDVFTYESFSRQLAENNNMLKTVLVGKNALLVGLSNSSFQDIIYRARLHPKRKGAQLGEGEKRALFDAIKLVIEERLRLGGKDQFIDIHGERGGYQPTMGPNMKNKNCPRCGTAIKIMQVGGGRVYFCPKCQK